MYNSHNMYPLTVAVYSLSLVAGIFMVTHSYCFFVISPMVCFFTILRKESFWIFLWGMASAYRCEYFSLDVPMVAYVTGPVNKRTTHGFFISPANIISKSAKNKTWLSVSFRKNTVNNTEKILDQGYFQGVVLLFPPSKPWKMIPGKILSYSLGNYPLTFIQKARKFVRYRIKNMALKHGDMLMAVILGDQSYIPPEKYAIKR